MAEERRSARRARIAGVRVTYESATGDHVETDALNLGPGGLFVRSAKQLAVGKRISLEIQVAGELVPWSALGRVVWTRERDEGERRPAGMGVKLIDVEDSVVTTIERLVAGREPTEAVPADAALPARDPAAIGAESSVEATPPAPVVQVAPSRERTILGVGAAAAPVEQSGPRGQGAPHDQIAVHEASVSREPSAPRAPGVAPKPAALREPSVVIDLVARDHDAGSSSDDAAIRTADVSATLRGQRVARNSLRASPYEAAHASEAPTLKRRKRGGGAFWVIVLVILAIAAAVGYVVADGDVVHVLRPSEPVAAPPAAPAPPRPSTPLTVTAPAVAIPPAASAISTASASVSATPLPAATPSAAPTAPKKPPSTVPPPARPAVEPPAKRPAPPPDNPY